MLSKDFENFYFVKLCFRYCGGTTFGTQIAGGGGDFPKYVIYKSIGLEKENKDTLPQQNSSENVSVIRYILNDTPVHLDVKKKIRLLISIITKRKKKAAYGYADCSKTFLTT